MAKGISLAVAVLLAFAASVALGDDIPQFKEYEVPLYKGEIRQPKWIRHVEGDMWRDELEKSVDPPEINFAGRYFVAVHSCGTSCRYYTLTDLSSGRDLDLLNQFATAEPPPKTQDGHEYMTILFSRPNSRMLVAQYHLELGQAKEECRERVFLLEKERLKPITKTRRECRENL
jgi:hypothetical protein